MLLKENKIPAQTVSSPAKPKSRTTTKRASLPAPASSSNTNFRPLWSGGGHASVGGEGIARVASLKRVDAFYNLKDAATRKPLAPVTAESQMQARAHISTPTRSPKAAVLQAQGRVAEPLTPASPVTGPGKPIGKEYQRVRGEDTLLRKMSGKEEPEIVYFADELKKRVAEREARCADERKEKWRLLKVRLAEWRVAEGMEA
ncbi:hypothetical protein MKEN_01129400 [Mycena kentingensis (nom. inval.)]|nr:hypothetical protein MKEN_01129400 [Mycena kentingensis (nom. inval.)]